MIPVLHWVLRWKIYVNLGIIINLKPAVVTGFVFLQKKHFKIKAY